jgi:prolyl-tRNA synthetase
MRYSRAFLPTLKESPSDAEVISHKLMVRAGMIRKVAAGIYNLLPLGTLVMRKVEAIVREEMKRAGAEEVVMPFVIPSELWKESGRWEEYGKELTRLKDRHDRDFCLGPTHEEVITDMVKRDVKSYKALPMNLFQIETKFRDEIRPRFGLMRGREFVMKDAYSFHADMASAEAEYKSMHDTYSRIFARLGLEFRAVEADSGNIGGSFSHEFMVMADTGEDAVACCRSCEYAANVERAEIGGGIKEPEGAPEGALTIEKVSTPGVTTIDEVSGFLKVDPKILIKTLIYNSDKGLVAVLSAGDREINPIKVKKALDAEWAELAEDASVEKATGAPVGFAGPVGLKIPVLADFSVCGIAGDTGAITGGNEKDTHIKNVFPARDFKADYFDLVLAEAGDKCPKCDATMEIKRGIEVGHIFMLGTKYSEAMECFFLDENGKTKPMIMGCYGIGIGRSAAAAIEQNHDDWGIIWPKPLAPYMVSVVPINMKDAEVVKAADDIYEELIDMGVEVLIDDRNERPGVKFKDLDLIGIPYRIAVSTKTLAEDSVEFKERGAGVARLVKRAQAIDELLGLISE